MSGTTTSRDPSDAIKRELRTEVNFGCPVQGCGCPILTYHHFDPPWADNFIHSVPGMIALCHTHHDQADGGGWTKGQLQEMKRNPFVDDLIRVQWPYSAEHLLLKVGPCFVVRRGSALSLNGRSVMHFKPETIEQLATRSVSFDSDILDASGLPWLRIDQNSLDLDTTRTMDLIFTPQIKKFRAQHKDRTCLNLKFSKHEIERLEKWIESAVSLSKRDRDRGKTKRDIAQKFFKTIVKNNTIDSDGRVPVMEVTGHFRTPEVSIRISSNKFKVNSSQSITGKPETVVFSSHLVSEENHISLRYDKSRNGGREFLRIG